MEVGAIAVLSVHRFRATIYVERELTANAWTLTLDGAEIVTKAPIPDPFTHTIEPVGSVGEHPIEAIQFTGQAEVVRGSAVLTVVTESMRPLVVEVASLIRARTKDAEGREVGTFNTETRPTESQVEMHIDAAVSLIGARLPADVPEAYHGTVRSLVAYRAALQIEKSYFPEQVRSDRSAYDQLREEYQDDLGALIDALGGDGEDGSAAGGAGLHSLYTPTFLRVVSAGGSSVLDDHWPEPENPANWQDPFQPPREPPLPEDLPVGDEPASGWPA